MGLLDSVSDTIGGSKKDPDEILKESIEMGPRESVEKYLEAIELSEQQGSEDHSTCTLAHLFLGALMAEQPPEEIAELFEDDPLEVADGHLKHAQSLLNNGQSNEEEWFLLWSRRAGIAAFRDNYGVAIDFAKRATRFETMQGYEGDPYNTLAFAHSQLGNEDLSAGYKQEFNQRSEN